MLFTSLFNIYNTLKILDYTLYSLEQKQLVKIKAYQLVKKQKMGSFRFKDITINIVKENDLYTIKYQNIIEQVRFDEQCECIILN